MLTFLEDLEKDLQPFMELGFADGEDEQTSKRMETMCGEMRECDKLIGKSMRMLQQIEERQADREGQSREGEIEMLEVIESTIGGLAQSAKVVMVESRELE